MYEFFQVRHFVLLRTNSIHQLGNKKQGDKVKFLPLDKFSHWLVFYFSIQETTATSEVAVVQLDCAAAALAEIDRQ